ncbi:hypothetical protein HK099_004438 [Clydaea vesicula]|uniref:Uncharacterized protein n=1 Tax=Clydaea vesicula TaxID=447962 RepID=A0AAD5U538_9FUNG|nr:hypothetical protein HK099_004438 [Clydaea vesicula]
MANITNVTSTVDLYTFDPIPGALTSVVLSREMAKQIQLGVDACTLVLSLYNFIKSIQQLKSTKVENFKKRNTLYFLFSVVWLIYSMLLTIHGLLVVDFSSKMEYYIFSVFSGNVEGFLSMTGMACYQAFTILRIFVPYSVWVDRFLLFIILTVYITCVVIDQITIYCVLKAFVFPEEILSSVCADEGIASQTYDALAISFQVFCTAILETILMYLVELVRIGTRTVPADIMGSEVSYDSSDFSRVNVNNLKRPDLSNNLSVGQFTNEYQSLRFSGETE